MTSSLFLADVSGATVGSVVRVVGEEARHAEVKRIALGERVRLADGEGFGVDGVVVEAGSGWFDVRVERLLREVLRRRITAVQALAKGDRALLAVQMLTELGAHRIVAWQSERSIVRWKDGRADKALDKWAATARESAKQSRRLSIPKLSFSTTKQLPEHCGAFGTMLVLHEDAEQRLRDVEFSGDVCVVIGPEGGIAPSEMDLLVAAGARPVRIADHVLRTSTAGAVALGQLEIL